MRVMHVITGLGRGGAEGMLVKLLAQHRTVGVISHVISLGSADALENEVREAGASLVVLPAGAIVNSIKAAARLTLEIRSFAPDIIQGWMVHGDLFATASGILAGYHGPVLWNVRMSASLLPTEKLRTRILVRLRALLSRHPRTIIYNSFAGAHDHAALGFRSKRNIVIGNGFDCARFKPDPDACQSVRTELGIPPDGRIIALIAHYRPEKDHVTFLRAVALTISRGYPIYCVLAGLGVDDSCQRLRTLVAELGLGPYIRLLGQRTDLPRILAACDIAASCSRSEAFSNVIGEAMACGVPCVVTDVGDSAYVVGDAGIVVPPGDAEVMSNAWMQLLRNAGTRSELGSTARRRVVDNFSIEAVSRKYIQLYEDLLSPQ